MKISRFAYLIAPALLLGLLFFGCRKTDHTRPASSQTPVSADVRVVATVNGEPITLAEFQERFARSGFKPDEDGALVVKKDFLNRLIERIMLLREAQRRRIKVGLPAINQRIEKIQAENGENVRDMLASQGIDYEKWKADIWEDLMIEKLLARVVNRHAAVSSREVRQYYTTHPQEFEKPVEVRARQIVVATEEEAQQVLASLRAGADFAAVARDKSTAPEAERGGDLGYFARGQMPSAFNVVFGMQKGAISGPVKSPYGYHIFKLEDRRKSGKLSFDEAYKGIAEKLRRQKEDKRYGEWITALRSRTKFEVNYEALEN